MSMGDDVASATMQVSMKAAETAIDTASRTVDRTIDNIAKLLQALMVSRGGRNPKDVKATDLTEIKSGEVKMKDLLANARKLGENITSSDHALTQADMKYVAKKAKEYGIPVSFTRGKDNATQISNLLHRLKSSRKILSIPESARIRFLL